MASWALCGVLSATACGAPAATPPPVLTGSDRAGAHCVVIVTDAQGCGPRQVEALIAPVRPRIEACHGVRGGTVKIHAQSVSGKLTFDITPGSTLDPTERECVLAALSTITSDDSATSWQGAGVPPSGFSSFITVEW